MGTLLASGSITIFDQNDAIISGVQPVSPAVDALWIDTSITPNMLKKYNGTTWDPVSQLDPNIVNNIGDIQSTLNNMADDSKLDFKDRQKLKENIAEVIGVLLTDTEAMPTVTTLDARTEGSFSRNRRAARNAGILTTDANYVALTNAYNTLRTYLSTHTPKSWDTSVANKDKVITVAKATFRQHWLNYYNAELALAESSTTFLSTGLSALKETTIPALQDRVLSEAEKTSIRSSLMLTQKEKKDIDAIFTAYNTNASLVSKTVITTPYAAYTTAYNETITAIDNILAVATGTTIPGSLTMAVNTKFANYADKLALLRAALQSAQKTIETKIATDAANNLSTQLSNYVTALDLSKLQDQVDGSITSHFGSVEPTMSNVPANSWTTTVLKDTHLGDLYYDDITGYSYRFSKKETIYSWIRITDSDITLALEMASKAQDTADGKRRMFTKTPTPPYDVGDLWAGGSTTDLMKAIVARATGTYVADDWEKAVKYTDDTAVDNLEIGGRNLLINSSTEKTGTREYLKYANLAPLFDEHGEGTYTFSFDLKSAVAGIIQVYSSDGTNSKHYYPPKNIEVTTEYKRYSMTVLVRISRATDTNTSLAFYGVYDSGRIPSIKNVKIEKGNKATGWTEAQEDVLATIESARLAAEAYAKTKAEAETVISKAYADGKVTAEEKRAIDDANAKLAAAKTYADTETAKVKALTVTAQQTADTAKANAETANNSLADITNDNKLTAGEKSALKIQWDSIISEFEKNKTQATNQAVSTTAYHNAYTSLSGIIGASLSEGNLIVTSAINGASLRVAFKAYYDARQVLLNEITEALNQKTIDLGIDLGLATSDNKTGILSGELIYTTKADDAVVHVGVDGKSYQGKNMVVNGHSEVKMVSTSSQYYIYNFAERPKVGTSYTFTIKVSALSNVSRFRLWLGEATQNIGDTVAPSVGLTSKTITWTAEMDAKYIQPRFRLYMLATDSTLPYSVTVDWIQLEEGTVATDHENFLGHIPTPDYPSTINSLDKSFDIVSSVGGRNLFSVNGFVQENIAKGYTTLNVVNKNGSVGFESRIISQNHLIPMYLKEKFKSNMQYKISFTIEWVSFTSTSAAYSFNFNYTSGTSTTNYARYMDTPQRYEFTTTSGLSLDYITTSRQYDGTVLITDVELKELRNAGEPYSVAPEDIQPNTQSPTLYKTNISLSEPLRSVGDVKDRLFLDSDGLWKVERNVGEILMGDITGVSTTAPYGGGNSYHFGGSVAFFMNTLNPPRSIMSPFASSHFKDVGNTNNFNSITDSIKYVGTIARISGEAHRIFVRVSENTIQVKEGDSVVRLVSQFKKWLTDNKVSYFYQSATPTIETLSAEEQTKLNNIQSFKGNNYVYTMANVSPNLNAQFKSTTFYRYAQSVSTINNLRQAMDTTKDINLGMMIGYSSFSVQTSNSLYFCGLRTNEATFYEELVDADGSIFNRLTKETIVIPKQALSLSGVPAGTTGYIIWDNTSKKLHFTYYKTTMGTESPTASSWKNQLGVNINLTDSVYVIGEIEVS